MGLFYSNMTVYRPLRSNLITALRCLRRTAYVSPTVFGCTVIYDRSLDDQDFEEIERLGSVVSRELSCAALASVLHDDDVLYLWLFQRGLVRDWYDSLPGYFDPKAEPGPPAGGDSDSLCNAFGRPNQRDRVGKILRANLLNGEMPELVGELERHQALVAALGLPAYAVGLGYEAIVGGYVPEQFRGIVFTPLAQA